MASGVVPEVSAVISPKQILDARKIVGEVYIDDKIKDYILDIVFATREPEKYGMDEMARFIEYGASPRASIALTGASKAHAFLRHRGYVTPEDIKSIGPDILRHRVSVTYEAEAEELSSEDVVRRIFDTVEVP
jgi:MoxR-like ATPase